MTTDDEAAARTYAEQFAADQRETHVAGTRINVLARDGKHVAEYRV